jgi:WD40 repeat protein
VYIGTTRGLIATTLTGKRVMSAAWLDYGSARQVVRTSDGGLVIADGVAPLRVDAHGMPVPGPFTGLLRPHRLAFDGDLLQVMPWTGSIVMTFDGKTGALVGSQATDLFFQTRVGLVPLRHDPALAGRIANALKLPGVASGSVMLSSDGKRLFVVGDARTNSSIVDLASMKATTGLLPFAASADGTRIVQQQMDSETKVDVRSVDGLQLVRTIDVPTRLVTRLELDDAGTTLAAEGEGKVVVYDVASGKVLLEGACQGTYTGSLDLSRDGSRLACDTHAATVVYDVRTKKVLKSIRHPRQDNADEVALSDDGRRLAVSLDYILIADLP